MTGWSPKPYPWFLQRTGTVPPSQSTKPASSIFQPFVLPEGADQPLAVLANWVALEALSPQTYRYPHELARDKTCVAKLIDPLPWTMGARARPGHKLFYQIVLGAVDMDGATRALIDAFGQDEERSRPERTKAALAVLTVDNRGIPVEEGVAVSSFGWALPIALMRKLEGLGEWPIIEPRITDEVADMFRAVDEAGKPLPVTLAQVHNAHTQLIRRFGLDKAMVEAPSFAIKVHHWFAAKTPPDPLLLNSFYINDLIRAQRMVQDGKAPPALASYLGITPAPDAIDLTENDTALEAIVAPARMPPTQWPARGGHPLVLLQQAAVNASQQVLAGHQGVLAVNGPPGTGKTTLLRDIIAARVCDRARAMAGFENPNDAFRRTPHASLFELDARLKGHEVVVASSNNKAVENVSRELPGLGAIEPSAATSNYFKSISDNLFKAAETDGETADKVPAGVETWGLVAAVLGNMRNRGMFYKRFWWDGELGFQLYLKAAKGDSVLIDIKDEAGRVIGQRPPKILASEQPPSPPAARQAWSQVRDHFHTLLKDVENETAELEALRSLCVGVPRLRQQVSEAYDRYMPFKVRYDALAASLTATTVVQSQAQELAGMRRHHLEDHRQLRPNVWSWLFQTMRWKAWRSEEKELIRGLSEARQQLRKAEEAYLAARRAHEVYVPECENAHQVYLAANTMLENQLADIRRHGKGLETHIIDEAFFLQPHDKKHLTTPWLPAGLQRKREQLFIASLAVQRAFIDVAADKFLTNLGQWMNLAPIVADKDKSRYVSDLWATLFAVIPVISTTFASVERMLAGMTEGSFGWLLVDEAGQATPQAAVGAIMRAQRTIMVGDPLQIEPVVSLPDGLVSRICRYFSVSKDKWAAPDVSAQVLADRVSPFAGSFRTDTGKRQVGVPLLVHRRCQEPMFGISNAIAYERQMVFAPPPAHPGEIGTALGPSRWIAVAGKADSKWCPEEGEELVKCLETLARAGVKQPDVFMISPFRIVAEELRRRLERETGLLAALGITDSHWLRDHIGTVHTFQGREADTVFIILGAPESTQQGARNWATQAPNLLNVAVSRARQNLYVIGSRTAWSGSGYARELAYGLA